MTAYQWVTLALGAVGFVITWTGTVIGLTRFAENIKQDTSEKIAAEVLARTKALADAVEARNEEMEVLRKEVAESQRSQDHVVGEMGAALRRYIETVEKEMHKIELYGRDNYVQKQDFEKAIDKLSAEIKALGSDIKADLKEMKADLSH
jgi:hypothetical protein